MVASTRRSAAKAREATTATARGATTATRTRGARTGGATTATARRATTAPRTGVAPRAGRATATTRGSIPAWGKAYGGASRNARGKDGYDDGEDGYGDGKGCYGDDKGTRKGWSGKNKRRLAGWTTTCGKSDYTVEACDKGGYDGGTDGYGDAEDYKWWHDNYDRIYSDDEAGFAGLDDDVSGFYLVSYKYSVGRCVAAQRVLPRTSTCRKPQPTPTPKHSLQA